MRYNFHTLQGQFKSYNVISLGMCIHHQSKVINKPTTRKLSSSSLVIHYSHFLSHSHAQAHTMCFLPLEVSLHRLKFHINGIIEYTFFWVCLYLFSVIILLFICIFVCTNSLFLFIAKQHFLVYIYPICLFIHIVMNIRIVSSFFMLLPMKHDRCSCINRVYTTYICFIFLALSN